MDDLARLVGERLRAARRERGLSVGALAEAAGIGKGSLSEIENGDPQPDAEHAVRPRGHARRAARDPARGPPGGADRLPRHRGATARRQPRRRATVEVYRLRIEPGVPHRSVAHGPGVTEHLLVTAGRARVGRLGEETEIGPGEAARWVSDVVHSYTAVGTGPVRIGLVIRCRA